MLSRQSRIWLPYVCLLVLGVAQPQHALANSPPRRLDLNQIMKAARANPLSRAARQATLAMRARAAEARAARIGSLSVTSFVAPSPSVDCLDVDCTRTSTDQASLALDGVFTGVRVSLVQPLYTFGKLSAVSRAAGRAVVAMKAKEGKVAGRVAVEVGRAYFGLKLARELRWMLEDGKEQIYKARKQLVQHLEAGTGGVTIPDKLRLETLLAEVDTRLLDAKAGEASALATIRAIVRDQTIDIDEVPLEPTKFALASTAEGYLARARRSQPQLDEAKAGLKAIQALQDLERAKLFPDFAVVAGFNFAYAQGVDNPPSAFANDPYNGTSATLALVLRWKLEPLMRRARLAHARANTRRASATVEAATAAAELAATLAYTKARQSKTRLTVARQGEKSAKGWVASVLQTEAIGVISAKDVADAYIAYFTARARVLQNMYDWNLAVLELRREIGEFSLTGDRRTKS